MGRTAGHLALGIGKATGATAHSHPGRVSRTDSNVATVCDILEGAILKRRALWNRPDGVAVIAEGLLEHMPVEELEGIEGVRITHDSYGHLRLAEVDLAYILKTLVEHRFAGRWCDRRPSSTRISAMSCARRAPVAFDCEYVRTLGYGAVEFLLNPSAAIGPDSTGALVALIDGQLEYLDFPASARLQNRQNPSPRRRYLMHRPTRSLASI